MREGENGEELHEMNKVAMSDKENAVGIGMGVWAWTGVTVGNDAEWRSA